MKSAETARISSEKAGQRDRLQTLLDELDRAHGPVDPAVLEDVRRRWPKRAGEQSGVQREP